MPSPLRSSGRHQEKRHGHHNIPVSIYIGISPVQHSPTTPIRGFFGVRQSPERPSTFLCTEIPDTLPALLKAASIILLGLRFSG